MPYIPTSLAVQVATRRVKQANKAEIPLLDDHVSKIEHIGRETVKKLADMKAAAAEIGMTLRLADNVSHDVYIQGAVQYQKGSCRIGDGSGGAWVIKNAWWAADGQEVGGREDCSSRNQYDAAPGGQCILMRTSHITRTE